MRLGRTWSVALAAGALGCGGATLVASCGNDENHATAPDGQASPDAETPDLEGGVIGEGGVIILPDGAVIGPDGALIDAGPCPGMTSCGGVCVQTRTDMNNCGGCGIVCTATPPSTAVCAIGKCIVTLATASTSAGSELALAVHGSDVFYAQQTAGTISRVPTAGGTPTTIVTGQTQPHSLVADSTSVYWAVNGTNAIWKAQHDGGAPTKVTSSGQVVDLAIDSTTVYYTTGFGYVMSAPLTGGTSKTVSQTNGVNYAGHVAVDSTKVYFSDQGVSIYSAPIDGGTGTPIIASSGIPQSGLAITPGELYWGTGSLTQHAPLDGGLAVTRVPTPLYGIAFDGADLFGYTPTGSIVKIALAGGSFAQTLSYRATNNSYDIATIAVDQTSVYWTEYVYGSGIARVMKLSPK
jgi:hypothetical protein